uniref:Uncharacterized protein n=1 Tax=Candidatus Kentrum sp. LFY TaxID=2126342 RepID=A0A450WD06_9GAMM|nr:MAG: hypothetical protein BECKLFY1418C_GA0070996_10123 [Candidatus Kentron sp. LFY]
MKNDRRKPREMTPLEWTRMGTRIFGKDQKKWKFVCPKCGRIQSPKEFLAHKDKGAKPDDAYRKCIGQFDAGNGCNYTADQFTPVPPVIIKSEKKRIRVFDFAGAAG